MHLHKKHKIGKKTLKHWIAKNPTANLIYADDEFRNVTSGSTTDPYECRKNSPNDKELNQGVAAVGYDKHENYLIKNSWGTSWGDGGYLLLKKGKECGLRKRVYRYNWAGRLGAMVGILVLGLMAAV